MAKRGRPTKHVSSEDAMNIFPDTEATGEHSVANSTVPEYGELDAELPNPEHEGSFEEVLKDDFVNDTEKEAPIHTKKTPSTLGGELPPTSRREATLPDKLPATQEDIIGTDLRSIMTDGREHLLSSELIKIMEDKEEESKRNVMKAKGRFIEGQDTAKPGVPYSNKSPEYYHGNSNLTPQKFINADMSGMEPEVKKKLEGHEDTKALPTMRSEGVVLKEIETLDTAAGAQNKQTLDNQNKTTRSNNTFICPEEDPLETKSREMQKRGDKNLKVSW